MYSVVVVIHILACVALIMIVLLQTGRGAEMGAAFGGASQTLFGGGGGTTFLSKLTTAAAVIFMLTCLGLSYISSGPQTRSVMDNVPVEKPQGPAIPDATPVQPVPEQPAAAAKPVVNEAVPAQPAQSPVEQAAPVAPPAAKESAPAPAGKKAAAPSEQGKQSQKKAPATQSKQQ